MITGLLRGCISVMLAFAPEDRIHFIITATFIIQATLIDRVVHSRDALFVRHLIVKGRLVLIDGA